MMKRRWIARGVGRLLPAIALAFLSSQLQAQTLFEVRYEPSNPSAVESAGDVEVNVVVDLVNSAPTAVDDSFQFDSPPGSEFCTFSQPAPGVLANDSDPDGDPLTAVPISPPAELTLNPDGSFSFGPTSCFEPISFSYVAQDPFFDSNVATVDFVLNAIPTAVAGPIGVPYNGTTGFPVDFDGTLSNDNDGTIVSYVWDFGDGNMGMGSTPSHTYTLAGTYVATLTVTDDLGAQDSDSRDVFIIDPIPFSSSGAKASNAHRPGSPSSVVQQPRGRLRPISSATSARVSVSGSSSGLPTVSSRLASVRPTSGPANQGSRSQGRRTSQLSTRSTNGTEGVVCCSANYSALSGTATAGEDFIAIPDGTLNWSLDDSFPLQLSYTLTLLDDDLAEGDETVNLTLSSPDFGVSVLTPNATFTIIDDEVLGGAAFDSTTYQADETDRTATITVVLNGDSPPNGGTIDYEARAGSATAGQDFEIVSGTLTWEEGDIAPKTFEVPINNDELNEGDETVELLLSNPVRIELGSPSEAELIIRDDDALGSVQFRSAAFEVDEGAGTATILVDLTGSTSSGAASVDYSAAAGTATAGEDFVPTNGTLTWESGTAGTMTFSIEILDDNLLEEDETVLLDPEQSGRHCARKPEQLDALYPGRRQARRSADRERQRPGWQGRRRSRRAAGPACQQRTGPAGGRCHSQLGGHRGDRRAPGRRSNGHRFRGTHEQSTTPRNAVGRRRGHGHDSRDRAGCRVLAHVGATPRRAQPESHRTAGCRGAGRDLQRRQSGWNAVHLRRPRRARRRRPARRRARTHPESHPGSGRYGRADDAHSVRESVHASQCPEDEQATAAAQTIWRSTSRESGSLSTL